MARRNIPKKTFGKEQWAPTAQVAGNKERLHETPDVNLSGGNHFATRERAHDLIRFMRSLPDRDLVLRKIGKSITSLQELLTDSHLESVWSIRCSAISGAQWFMAPGEGGGRKEQEAADNFAEQLKALDVSRIIEEMMDAVAYGYVPMEILWKKDGDFWGIENIVGKSPQWFEFDPDNRLLFRGDGSIAEPVPDNRFLLIQHRQSYLNPYGDKTFSKCFWPVTFKKKGWQWWTVFIEKYGGAFLYGKYPNNFSDELQTKLLDALNRMVSDAVAIFPEGSEVTIESLANKGSVSNVHLEYINAANAEISKAVLGQTLTTELSGKAGSYATAQTHNLVREGLAKADRSRISAAFDRLARMYTLYNFGSTVIPPQFTFIENEELYIEQVKRDVQLYSIGWRPTKAYIAREYAIPEEDFSVDNETQTEKSGSAFDVEKESVRRFNRDHARSTGDGKKQRKSGFLRSLFRSFVLWFASKREKIRTKDKRLMKEFSDLMLESGQEAIDAQIERYVDALGTVDDFEDARAALLTAYNKQDYGEFASTIDEVRFVAQGLGGTHGKR
jgi:phage gp29-like protein